MWPADVAVPIPRRVARRFTARSVLWRRFRRNRAAVAGLCLVALIALLALLAPLLVRYGNHHPPNRLYTDAALDQRFGTPLGPNGEFWFGADPSGRDLFSRAVYGARSSLAVALLATIIGVAAGTVTGMLAGYYRGWIDVSLSRLVDVMLAFPVVLLALGLGASCGGGQGCVGGLIKPGRSVAVFVIALVSWPYLARIIRGQVVSLREETFVEAARASGCTNGRILFREIGPNLGAPIVTFAAFALPANILLEAGLSFLGVGTRAPDPSWGQMIADAVGTVSSAWWYFLFPGLLLVATVLGFTLVADGLRDALDRGGGGW